MEGEDRAAYISAASAVVRRGDFIYVIGDDELDLGVFTVSEGKPGEMRPALSAGSEGDKPDVEALTALPPFEGAPYGALFGLGSGSKRSRDRGFVWEIAPDGSLRGDSRAIDLHPLYERLRGEIEELNVEGAAVLGDDLWLFHRGNDEESANAVVEVALGEAMASLREDAALEVNDIKRVRAYDLGELGGTRLSFSDATALTDELIVFTASAEAEGGGIHGSVVGTISGEGIVERLRTIDRRWKVEGVHAAIDTGVIDFVFVCDQDADEPSPLLSATMPADAALEAG
ncbi:MAG: DUF6929 family protein [Solirubrobacterales bacterium]